MKVIEPQPISLLSSSVPEDDAPAWNMETAYQVGEPVVYAHKVYKAVSADNNVGKQPDQHCDGTAAFWRLVGPTNRYAMLDQYVSTQTAVPTDAGALSFTVTFNRCTAFALLAFKAATIRTVVRDGDGIILHDKTVTTLKDVDDYWQYYFRKLEYIEDLGLFPQGNRRVRQYAPGQAGQRQAYVSSAVPASVPDRYRAGNPRPAARRPGAVGRA